MANYIQIVPFIKKWEGEYGNDPDDAGGETRMGITYKTWTSVFGDTHDRFMAMSDADWGTVFKKLFWDPMHGDEINSQIIAEIMVDWMWCSGKTSPAKRLQTVLVQNFKCAIGIDGALGRQTVQAINSVDEKALLKLIVDQRFDFLNDIVAARPQNQKFLKGWQNRINDLLKEFAPGMIG